MICCTSIYTGVVPYILHQGMTARSRSTESSSNNRQHIYQQLLLTSRQHKLLLPTPHYVKLPGWQQMQAPQFQECLTFDTCHLSIIRSHNSFLCYCIICTHELVMTACFLIFTDVLVFSMEILTESNQTFSLRSSVLCSIVKFLQGLFLAYLNICFLTVSALIIPQSIGTRSIAKISHWLHITPTSRIPCKRTPAGPLILFHLVASKFCLEQALIMSSFRLSDHRSMSLQPSFCVVTPFPGSPNMC